MFEKPTLLILGAGASLDYGFPLGEDLIRRILKNKNTILSKYEHTILQDDKLSEGNILESIRDRFKNISDTLYDRNSCIDPNIRPKLKSLLNKAPLTEEDLKVNFKNYSLNVLCTAIKKHLDVYNKYILALLFFQRLEEFDPISIDFFLSIHAEFEYEGSNIGKFAIAYEILECKKEFIENRLQGYAKELTEKGEELEVKRFSSWYKYLLDKILKGCQGGNQKEIINNNLSVITFNYDTSLESFLKGKLNNMNYFKTEEENYADKFLSDFLSKKIKHIYGEIDLREIYETDRLEEILKKSKKLRVIYEERYNPALKKEVEEIKIFTKNKIEDADKIFILGYAFDSTNNYYIGIKKAFKANINTGDSIVLGGSMVPKYVEIELKKEVIITNYEDSEIINKYIRRAIFDQLPKNNNIWGEMYIDLKKVRNLTITTKRLEEAIGSDFDFSDPFFLDENKNSLQST